MKSLNVLVIFLMYTFMILTIVGSVIERQQNKEKFLTLCEKIETKENCLYYQITPIEEWININKNDKRRE